MLRESAGEQLLSTYESERRPVGALTTEQAYTRYVMREAKYLNRGDLQPPIDDLNVEMGYRYNSSAVIPEAHADKRTHENPRESHGRPGTRAPHLGLEQDVSTLDLFGRNFALLTGGDGRGWLCAAPLAAKRVGVALEAHQIGHANFCDNYGISRAGAVLVRPDGFVAWRSRGASDSPEPTLVQTLSAVLHHPSSRRLVVN